MVDIGGYNAYRLNSNSNIDVDLLYTGVLSSIGNVVNRVRLVPAYNRKRRDYSQHLGIEMTVVGN